VADGWRALASFRIGATIVTNPPGALPNARAISAQLGIEPSHVHEPGERRSARGGPWKHGQWSLDSPLGEGEDLETHLRWLLERLLPVRAGILEIVKADPRLHADFFCGLYLKQRNERVVLSPQTLQGIGELDADLDLDIYWEGDDDPAASP
jgi:hypothetical protein